MIHCSHWEAYVGGFRHTQRFDPEACPWCQIERLTAELKETESRRDLAIANYVRTLAERDALTDKLIRAGLKA